MSVLTIVTFATNNIQSYSASLSIDGNQTINLNSIETKKIRVGDIDVGYKIIGGRSPILLINGFSAPLDFWDSTLIGKLASNHTVITFDNRGIGNTTAGIKQFFIRRFGRALPIGAFGQSALHDRWGYDHRNAMDVGVNPDSNEGQALIGYLRANGIPFTAFHFAVPGVATGPHIHVGLPSHRMAPRWVAANSRNISGQ